MNTSPLLTQALALVAGPVFTLVNAKALEQLEAQAEGEDIAMIAELWEAAYLMADEEALAYLHEGAF